jgi:small subunit ribosomal protein S20
MAAKLPKGRHRSAIKEARKAKKHYLRNRAVKKKIHSLVKKLELASKEKKQNEAKELLSQIFTAYDKAAKRRIIHPNTAARKKSRLSHRYNTLFSTGQPKN